MPGTSKADESMFDKLGDLLSQALDSGFIFSEPSPANSELKDSLDDKENLTGDSKDKSEPVDSTKASKKSRSIPEALKISFDFISIPYDSDFEEAKKAYREKLKYYHPDRRNDNPVLQKVAKEKTAQLLEHWAKIEAYFTGEN